VNYKRRAVEAQRVVTQIETEGGTAEACQTDVTVSEQVQQMFKGLIAHHGHIDVLINNAGLTRDEYFLMMRLPSWRDLVDIHLHATFNCCKAVARTMCAAGRGVIINIGSGSALVPMPGQVNYSATKAGLLAFSRSLARELASHGVRVLHVAPGFFKTDMTELLDAKFRAETYQLTPLGRWGLPDELASVVGFLASDDASFVLGQTFPIDGGRGAIEADFGFEQVEERHE
jgi:3-oxoacyl-[acyl-carrier protein] reductase